LGSVTLSIVLALYAQTQSREPQSTSLNPEIEATARKQSDTRRKKKAEFAMVGRDIRALRDYAMPQSSGITSSTVNTVVEANNFKLHLALISLGERDQFGGHPYENPNMHLRKFLPKCDTSSSMGYPLMLFD